MHKLNKEIQKMRLLLNTIFTQMRYEKNSRLLWQKKDRPDGRSFSEKST